jgi:hypothetical protein
MRKVVGINLPLEGEITTAAEELCERMLISNV